ncbi:MFS transporter [Alicyclobacillus tolerans]|uniref:MFS transporter n=1 Tax=Alicyclobacillus tolerans TaxID=90970 RepID=UPI001F2CE685|nr:MFS transporter [Alicyclobacillus tolerans]MCF8567883.1 MFS transporter [Alicyclobacillus tolerans]
MTKSTENPLARLDRLPVWPFSYGLIALLGLGYFFSFFDITNIAYGLPVISKQFHVSTGASAEAVSTSLFGYIFGALILSMISDRFGRRLSLTVGVVLYTLGSLATAFSPSVGWLVGWRFVVGMGIGTMIAQVTTYLGELAPAALRGRLTGLANIFSFAGLGVVPFAAMWLVPNYSWGWRALLFLGALGGFIIFFAGRLLIESPRWLALHGRMDEVEKIVSEAEDRVRRRIGTHALPPVQPMVMEHKGSNFPLLELLKPPYLGRVLLLLVIWLFYYTGDYAFLSLAPTFLVDKGYSLASSISFLAVTGIAFVVAAIVVYWIGDKVERKVANLVWGILMMLSLLWIGYFPSPMVIMVGGFLATFSLSTFCITNYALTAEHFPTSARSSGVAIADGLGHLGGALAPFVGLWAYKTGGFSLGFGIMGFVMIVPILLLPFTVRATRRTLTSVTEVPEVSSNLQPYA